MNYKELLYNKDAALTFFPRLAVIFNKYDDIESEKAFFGKFFFCFQSIVTTICY